MTASIPRVFVPAGVARGDIFQVKAIISHLMETGLRSDPQGEPIPRKIINKFVCLYGGEVAFSVDLHESVASNPFFEFYLRATTSAVLEFTWLEDGGCVYSLSHDLVIT